MLNTYITCSCCGHPYSLVDHAVCLMCKHDELNNDKLQAQVPDYPYNTEVSDSYPESLSDAEDNGYMNRDNIED